MNTTDFWKALPCGARTAGNCSAIFGVKYSKVVMLGKAMIFSQARRLEIRQQITTEEMGREGDLQYNQRAEAARQRWD